MKHWVVLGTERDHDGWVVRALALVDRCTGLESRAGQLLLKVIVNMLNPRPQTIPARFAHSSNSLPAKTNAKIPLPVPSTEVPAVTNRFLPSGVLAGHHPVVAEMPPHVIG
jgi:hypothetical protein